MAHKVLSSLLPASGVSLAWTHAPPGQNVGLRSHAVPGLLIVLRGNAALFGGISARVKQGDVITLPSNHEYGFTEIGTDGLHALHVAFRTRADENVEQDLTLEALLARNTARAKAALEGPFFHALNDGSLDKGRQRVAFLECLRTLSDAFQVALLTRQATCRDENYQSAFREQLLNELRQRKVSSSAGDSPALADPILRATSSWFCHQMLVLDNAGKAIVHLALQTAGDHFMGLSERLLSPEERSEYLYGQATSEQHKQASLHVLSNHSPESYRRLQRTLEDSWNMFDAMTRRIAGLVELAGTSS